MYRMRGAILTDGASLVRRPVPQFEPIGKSLRGGWLHFNLPQFSVFAKGPPVETYPNSGCCSSCQ